MCFYPYQEIKDVYNFISQVSFPIPTHKKPNKKNKRSIRNKLIEYGFDNDAFNSVTLPVSSAVNSDSLSFPSSIGFSYQTVPFQTISDPIGSNSLEVNGVSYGSAELDDSYATITYGDIYLPGPGFILSRSHKSSYSIVGNSWGGDYRIVINPENFITSDNKLDYSAIAGMNAIVLLCYHNVRVGTIVAVNLITYSNDPSTIPGYSIFNDITYRNITYRLTNCTAPDAPQFAAIGSEVTVPLIFTEGFGVNNPSTDAYVMNNGVLVPSTYSNGTLTFTMP